MPRYFFHLQDGTTRMDEDGTEFTGRDEARAAAVTNAGEVLTELGAKFWKSDEWRLWVTDVSGATICTLRFTGE
jgi:hypothetical protein